MSGKSKRNEPKTAVKPSNVHTDKRLCVCAFIHCVCHGHSFCGGEGRSAMFHRNFKRGIKKIQDQPIKTRKLIISKIIKLIATGCHILRLKCTKFDYWCLSVCLFVSLFVRGRSEKRRNGHRLFVRWSLTLTPISPCTRYVKLEKGENVLQNSDKFRYACCLNCLFYQVKNFMH